MTKRFVVIAVLVLVAVVAIAGFFVAGHVDSYRPRVQAELQQKLNRPVTLGHLGLKLFPLSIRVDGFTIGESPDFRPVTRLLPQKRSLSARVFSR